MDPEERTEGQGLTGRFRWLSDSSLSKSGSSITKESICVAKGPSESLSESCCLEAEGAGGGRASGPLAAIKRLLGSAGGWLVRDFSSADLGGAEGSRSFKDFLGALGAKRKRKVRTAPGGLEAIAVKRKGLKGFSSICIFQNIHVN